MVHSSSNPSGPQTDPNLLYSKDSLVCDYHDSVWVDSAYYYYFDSLIYHVTSWNYSKVKITFDVQLTNDSLTSLQVWLHHNYNSTQGDTLVQYYYPHNPILNSYSFLFNLSYPTNFDFYLSFSLRYR